MKSAASIGGHFTISSNISIPNIFERHVLDFEAGIVPRKYSTQCSTVYFNRLYFSCDIDWSKDYRNRCEDTSFYSACEDDTNNINFVDIL